MREIREKGRGSNKCGVLLVTATEAWVCASDFAAIFSVVSELGLEIKLGMFELFGSSSDGVIRGIGLSVAFSSDLGVSVVLLEFRAITDNESTESVVASFSLSETFTGTLLMVVARVVSASSVVVVVVVVPLRSILYL